MTETSTPTPSLSLATTHQSFTALGLSSRLVRFVHEMGYVHPTPIQAAVIPRAIDGRDIVGLAETGSGKTAAFCLPIAEHLAEGNGLRALVLSPTREIALQTAAFLKRLARHVELRTVCVIGGVRMGPQIDGLRKDPDVVVATPGRFLDHMERGNLRLDGIEKLVLDEADRMLDLGFLPQINSILEALPVERQTMMFSATMPAPMERLAQRFMRQPVRVDLLPEGGTAEGITHRLYLVDRENKDACLLALVGEHEDPTLVFLRRKIDADWAYHQLARAGFRVGRIHSDRNQAQRVEALEGFRCGEFRILVATDIAARGLDIPTIEHVINYDMPETVEDYIHRSGRTARGERTGVVSNIATWQDKPMIKEIEGVIGAAMPRGVAPGVDPYVELETARRKRIRRRML